MSQKYRRSLGPRAELSLSGKRLQRLWRPSWQVHNCVHRGVMARLCNITVSSFS